MHGSSGHRLGRKLRARVHHRGAGPRAAAPGARAPARAHSKLTRVSALETRKDVRERRVRDAKLVVLVNAHLEVEAGELAQMAALLEFSARKPDPPRTRARDQPRSPSACTAAAIARGTPGSRRVSDPRTHPQTRPGSVWAVDQSRARACLRAALSQLLARRAAAARGWARTAEGVHARLDAHDGVVRGNAQSSQRLSRRCSGRCACGRAVSQRHRLLLGRAASSSRNGSTFAARERNSTVELQLDVRLCADLTLARQACP